MGDTGKKIAALNDALRKSGNGGRIVMTTGIQALGQDAVSKIIEQIRSFDTFTNDNDPYGEHDFGTVNVAGEKIYWKIDYYDKSLKYGSPDPSDPSITCRVMTIMLATEY